MYIAGVPSKPTPVAPPEAPPVATPSIDVPVAPPVGAPPPPGPPPPPPPGGPGAPPPPPPPGGPAAPKKQRHKFLPERADFKSKLPNQTMKVYWKKVGVLLFEYYFFGYALRKCAQLVRSFVGSSRP